MIEREDMMGQNITHCMNSVKHCIFTLQVTGNCFTTLHKKEPLNLAFHVIEMIKIHEESGGVSIMAQHINPLLGIPTPLVIDLPGNVPRTQHQMKAEFLASTCWS